MANGDRIVDNTAYTVTQLMDNDSNCQPHSVVNMSELLASSAAAYAHQPNLTAQCQSNSPSYPNISSSFANQGDLNHASLMNKAPVAINGTKKKPLGVPLFNHKNARDWIHKRACYNKDD